MARDPDDVDALQLLAYLQTAQGRHGAAILLLKKAAALKPEAAEIHFNLGNACYAQGALHDAVAGFEKALELDPGFTGALNNLANVLKALAQVDRAEACYRKLIDLKYDLTRTHSDLGNILLQQGRLDEAIASYRRALDIDPDFVRAHTNLVFAMNYHPGYSPEQISLEHRRWGRRHAEPLRNALPPPGNDRSPERRLRVGYVSPDFWHHPVCYFFEPVLQHHDAEQVEVFCYSDVARPDQYTERLQAYRVTWRDVVGLPDDALAHIVRRDQIDILVDLAGHTNDNRLLMFARKPAPIQVTWNGYPNTTGMDVMDYRITDGYADPPGMTENLHSERLLRLPEIYMAFQPPADSPPLGLPPVLTNGYITFGSFNAISKIASQVIEVWAWILRAVPGSRLVVLSVPEGRTRGRIIEAFAAHGVNAERLDLMWRLPFQQFLAAYQRVDIALDSFPYHGTSTTCQTLWMGVPLITLAGRSHVSRVGVSLLANLGLERFIARTPQEYRDLAVRLADNIEELTMLRSRLREMMMNSPNTDGMALTRHLERAYREVWRTWCVQPRAGGSGS